MKKYTQEYAVVVEKVDTLHVIVRADSREDAQKFAEEHAKRGFATSCGSTFKALQPVCLGFVPKEKQ
jgi:hypothetical protein